TADDITAEGGSLRTFQHSDLCNVVHIRAVGRRNAVIEIVEEEGDRRVETDRLVGRGQTADIDERVARALDRGEVRARHTIDNIVHIGDLALLDLGRRHGLDRYR